MTRHVDPKTLLDVSERPDNSPRSATRWPLSCTDGSLVINTDGTVSRATPEQRQVALTARAERAAMTGDEY
jgi:hypothetical protein